MAPVLHPVQPPLSLCMQEDTARALAKIKEYDFKYQALSGRLNIVGANQPKIIEEMGAYHFRKVVICSVMDEKNNIINDLRRWTNDLCKLKSVCDGFGVYVYHQFWLIMQALNSLSDNIPLMLQWQEKYNESTANLSFMLLYPSGEQNYELKVRKIVQEHIVELMTLVKTVFEEHGELNHVEFIKKYGTCFTFIFYQDPSIFDVWLETEKDTKRQCSGKGVGGVDALLDSSAGGD